MNPIRIRLAQLETANATLQDRLDEVENHLFSIIGALQVLGADHCDRCGMWEKDTWNCLDHSSCLKCLSEDPAWPLEDEHTKKERDTIAESVVRYLVSHGVRRRRWPDSMTAIYRRISR